MNLLFPMIYQLILRLLPDPSEQSVLLQKQILKIFFAITQVSRQSCRGALEKIASSFFNFSHFFLLSTRSLWTSFQRKYFRNGWTLFVKSPTDLYPRKPTDRISMTTNAANCPGGSAKNGRSIFFTECSNGEPPNNSLSRTARFAEPRDTIEKSLYYGNERL